MLPLLLDDETLERSGVVANNRMNRERRFSGTNSYCRDLRIDLGEFLSQRLRRRVEKSDASHDEAETSGATADRVAWLDLCCGRALALSEAAERFAGDCEAGRLRIVGIDLVVDRSSIPPHPGVEILEASLTGWTTTERFDLITCVHGLHYVGDKLAALSAMARLLKPDGLLAVHLDLQNLRHTDDSQFGKTVRETLVRAGFQSHSRFRRLTRSGPKAIDFPWTYLGADDTAGPNFTGQPAVNSWYGSTLVERLLDS